MFFAFCFSNAIAIQNDTIINIYSEVTRIFDNDTSNTDSLFVKDPGNFKAGDTVIIYQAKGVEWDYDLNFFTNLNFAGRFEYHIIFKKSTIGDTIILDHRLSIQNTFKFKKEHLVQIVKVPSQKKYIANKTLKAPPWDGAKGGIFALIVDTLELKADIDVTGKGFRGGDPSNDTSKGYCINSDSLKFLKSSYPFSAKDTAGLKGESVVMFDSLHIRGRYYLYNGGGGGPGYHAGGGGGGNFGGGGFGGGEACKCYSNCEDSLISTNRIALGGYPLDGGLLNQGDIRAVFGGGGGCGTRASTIETSKGGNGGGIVLIIANVLIGNGHSILADGQTLTDTSTIGGGGGGGGGAILLDVNKIEGSLNISVQGGNGGWTKGATKAGPGGGGGGGYIWYNGDSIPASDSIVNDHSPGAYGKNLFYRQFRKASAGNDGSILNNLIMPLSKFLFNIMPSDTIICAGDVPHLFNASHPKGGDGNYKYIWLRSKDKKNLGKFDTIQGANSMTYQEKALHDTTYYLRVVKVYNPYFSNDTVVDQSNDTLKVFVLPVIDNNKIFSTDTARCKGIALPKLTGSFPSGSGILKLSGGNGSYLYQWQISNPKWISATGDSNKIDYLPKQTYSISVRRSVKSIACKSVSNSINLMVLPKIFNNLISDTQWVCKGLMPDSLYGIKNIGGGDTVYHNYIYTWQERNNNSSWIDVTSNPNGRNHILPYLSDTMYYKRLIFSGQFNTCKDTSNILAINILDSIENNFIYEVDTAICGNTKPKDFRGDPEIKGGDKKYSYQWEKLVKQQPWTLIKTIPDTLTFNPGVMFDTTWFRRIALSGPRNCCRNTSDSMKLSVRPFIKNNNIINPDTTICYNQSPGILTATSVSDGDGLYKYTWLESVNKTSWTVASGIDTLGSYNAKILTDTTYFRRKINSGICNDTSKILKVTVLPLINKNILGPDFSICKGSKPDTLKGVEPEGGDRPNFKYLWLAGNDPTNISDIGNSNSNSYYISDTFSNIRYFKRVVKSGLRDCCIDTSNLLKIGIYDLPKGAISYFNDSICLGNDFTVSFALSGKNKFNFTYTDGKTSNEIMGTANNYNLTVNPTETGIYVYKILSLTDGNNCVAKELIGNDTLSVFKIPDAKAGRDSSVCGRKIQLNAMPSVGIGTWSSNPNVVFSKSDSISNPQVTVNDYGQHIFNWTENNGGCIDKDSIKVIFFEQPTSGFAGKDTMYPYLFQVKLNASAPALGKGSWSSSDTSIYFEDIYSTSTFVENLKLGKKNKLIWTVINGVCNAISDSVFITVEDLRIPQGFSPNNDGINDKFEIRGIENVKDAHLIILNKWGVEVYHNKNYKGVWEGKNNNGTDLPSDTYYYILNVIGRTYKGFIIIRR